MNSSKDYYSGFEGEPELVFARSDGSDFHLWEGFFSFIMDVVDPGLSGWDGLAKAYHLGLWDDHPFEVQNLPETIEQLRAVPSERLDEDNREKLVKILGDLVAFLDDAARAGQTITITRD